MISNKKICVDYHKCEFGENLIDDCKEEHYEL